MAAILSKKAPMRGLFDQVAGLGAEAFRIHLTVPVRQALSFVPETAISERWPALDAGQRGRGLHSQPGVVRFR
jgi:hypothetical protein